MSSGAICNLEKRVGQLEFQVSNRVYKYPLSGTLVLIPATKHKLCSITGFFVYDSIGNSVTVGFRKNSDLSVQVSSNTDMAGLTIFLFE